MIKAYAYGELGLKPKEYISMTHKDYVLLCIGHKQKEIERKIFERDLKYCIIQGWADPKKLPKKEILFPIAGEPIIKPKPLTKRQATKIKNFHNYLMSYGWRKKENG